MMARPGIEAETHGFATVIIGGGPAGTAVILAACRSGRLERLLDDGLAIVEASAAIGAGRIGDYAINSDSTADTFTDCIRNNTHPEFLALRDHPVTLQLTAAGSEPAPLELVGKISALIGAALQRMIAAHPRCAVLTQAQALQTQNGDDGLWRTRIQIAGGARLDLVSQNVVLATGAAQPSERLDGEMIGGIYALSRCAGRLMQSGDVLRHGGVQDIAARLAAKPHPRVAIVGGSTSAVAVAHALLTRLDPQFFGADAVTILHRRELRIYYPSTDQALAEGYTEFGPEDLCPISQRVFRFAGLRLDSRELIMQARGIGGRPPEPRLRLHALQPHDEAAARIIEEADLVIAALGYRPHALTCLDARGREIALFCHRAVAAPLVDDQCRVLDAQKLPLAGLFGIGLAAGFVPRGALGGEPSFSGQANGLWLWQTAVGSLIVDALTKPAARYYAPALAETAEAVTAL